MAAVEAVLKGFEAAAELRKQGVSLLFRRWLSCRDTPQRPSIGIYALCLRLHNPKFFYPIVEPPWNTQNALLNWLRI